MGAVINPVYAALRRKAGEQWAGLDLESMFPMAPPNCLWLRLVHQSEPLPLTKKVRRTIGFLSSVWCGQQTRVLELLQHLIVSREARLSSRPIPVSGRDDRTQRIRVILGCCWKFVISEAINSILKVGLSWVFKSILIVDLQKNYMHAFFLICICDLQIFVLVSFTHIYQRTWCKYGDISKTESSIKLV